MSSNQNTTNHPTEDLIIDEVEERELQYTTLERARGLSPQALARNAYARAINPWFISGPNDAGTSRIGVVPEGSGPCGFLMEVPVSNVMVDRCAFGANAPAGSVTPRMNVLGVVDPRGFPTDGYVQRENRVITETDTLLSEATDLASYAQHLMGEAGRNNADANRMRSEMRRLFQIVEELHSDVHESEAEAERRRREADQAMERACDLMARRRSLLESQHEPQQHLAQDRVVSRKHLLSEKCALPANIRQMKFHYSTYHQDVSVNHFVIYVS
uniref:Mediator of RNA polymerase II transcription subunit 7 n=1 Tax=Meloidogyne hapla TaxID=6305 RepID=A0A1I8BGF8_MELHA